MLNVVMHNITDHQFYVVHCNKCHIATATTLSQVDLLSIPGFSLSAPRDDRNVSDTSVRRWCRKHYFKVLRLHNNVLPGMDMLYGITLSISLLPN